MGKNDESIAYFTDYLICRALIGVIGMIGWATAKVLKMTEPGA